MTFMTLFKTEKSDAYSIITKYIAPFGCENDLKLNI